MPERRMKKGAERQSGSALAAVVVFSAILSMAGGGFLMVTGSGIQDEAQAFANDAAFQAAESGLLLGTRWLRAQTNLAANADLFSGNPLVVNGVTVTVSVVDVAGDQATVRAQAQGPELGYVKRLEWRVQKRTIGSEGTFVNGMQPGRGHGVGGDGLNNVTIDGPFHANESIILSSVSDSNAAGASVKFVNGKVSTHNDTALTNFTKSQPYTTGDWGNYGDGAYNNYDFGVYAHHLKQNEDKGSDMDQIFTEDFQHTSDFLQIEEYSAPDLILSTSEEEQGNPSDYTPARRATLIFNADGSANYYYWSRQGQVWTANNQVLQPEDINGKLLRVPDADLNVLGTVSGKVSVMTDTGHSIFAVGSLVYDGFSPDAEANYDNFNNGNNYGIGNMASNQNIIGLVSGKDLFFAPTWKDPRDGVNPSIKNVTGDADGNLYFSGMLVAANEGGTNMWTTLGNGNPDLSLYAYDLHFMGSRTLDKWFNYTAGGVSTNTAIRFYYDTRLAEGLRAPGLPEITSGESGLMRLDISNWREYNDA